MIYIIKIYELYCIIPVISLFLYYFNPIFLLSIFTEQGGSYCSCIHVYEYPAESGEFWLSNLTSKNRVYAVIDVGTQPHEETTTHLNHSLAELEGRMSKSASHSDAGKANTAKLPGI